MLTPVDDVPHAFRDVVVEAFAARPGPRFALVLSGGPTARACYEVLAAAAGIDWAVVDVYVGDERLVPPDDEDSNARLIREALLDRVGPVGSFSPMPTERPVEECVAAYQRVVSDVVTGPGIDLIHLGMGPDGHTASLFPGDPSLDAGPGRLVLATQRPQRAQPAPPPDPDAAGHQLGPPRRLHGGGRIQGGRGGGPGARRGPAGGAGARRAHDLAGGRPGARRRPLDWPRCSPTPTSSACRWPT